MGIIPEWMKNFFRDSSKEKEYTWWELVGKEVERDRKYELEKVNLPIRMRNKVRDNMERLTEKALEISEKETSIEEIIEKLCELIDHKIDEEEALENAIREIVVLPLVKAEEIVLTRTMLEEGRIIFLFQNTECVDRFIEIGEKLRQSQELLSKDKEILKQEILEFCKDTEQPPQNIIRYLCEKMELGKYCYKIDHIMGEFIDSLFEEGKLDWNKTMEVNGDEIYNFMDKPVEKITPEKIEELNELATKAMAMGARMPSIVSVPLYKTVEQ